ncbi:phage holin family protein [Burkholderia sp. 4701]|nr:phage holin family protein [Burkholderia sp. 4701]MXN84157.1 phage holin family protein [Burkholderia sp. 4812]RQR60915.1 phage holin family protein [Burkholderia sp. Bp9125]
MHLPLALVALAAHLAALARVLTYRRNGARHRRRASWVAWALVAVTGGASIELVLHAQSVRFFEAATAVLLAMCVYGTRGNVARLLRSE